MRVFLRTFGCRANHYDSEQVRQAIEAAGGEVVASVADADAAVFNSCAVTSAAESELRRGIRRAARERPALRTVVMGCAAALDRGALRELPTVHDVVGGADVEEVAAALGLPLPSAGLLRGAQSTARGLLRVQDGCDEHCTFCVTTIARGANRSRAVGELVAEARRLAERHPEIVLTGVHIGSFGRDIGSSLGELLERLVRDVEGARFRLSSVEATELDDRLVELLRDGRGRVAPYLHAPLQSGSDRLLRRMGRHWYTSQTYAAAIERLTAGRDVFGIGADVIAAFPGETEDDHRATLALVERLPFTSLHVFPYSPRPGTAATRLPEPVDPTVAARRAAELRALAAEKGAAYRARRVGGEADVVVVASGEGRREGLTEDYLTVLPSDPALPRGSRHDCRLRWGADGRTILADPI
ncbi:MAG TPA: MiaB/RimO family radical SAM methylthiotransferase [Gemmatimonadales bacterium]